MLPASKRLSSTELIKARLLVKDGALTVKTVSFQWVFLKVWFAGAGNSLESSKFAVAVSKKVAKTAVARNRVRRQVYTQLREVQSERPVWCLVTVTNLPTKEDLQNLATAVTALLRSLK